MPTAAPAPHTDALIRAYEGEIEERNALIQGIAQDAQSAGNRDLNDTELEQINRARGRIAELTNQLQPLLESSKVAIEARHKTEMLNAELSRYRGSALDGPAVEYRSAGEYIRDLDIARSGDRDAQNRVEVFHRAAAHQTTADNPGLLPVRIVEPLLNRVDAARPLVSTIGPTALGEGSWSYARVTQHTQVGVQAAEKAELASRKMLVTLTPITAPTYGGYVNLSRQDIRRTGGRITDMVLTDLAGQYAIATEDSCAADLVAAATAATTTIPAASTTAMHVSQAVWGAVGQAATNLRAAGIPAIGPVIAASPNRMQFLGPLFPAVNAQNAISTGFTPDIMAEGGQAPNLAGLTMLMSPSLATNTILFFFRSAVACYEDRYGALQVDEPSVYGTQVGYAGDFETVVFQANGVISIGVV